MTRDDVLRIAREAGLHVGENLSGVMLVGHAKHDSLFIHLDIDDLERFAALVRAALVRAAALEEVADMVNACDRRATPKGIAAAIQQLKETK